MRLFEATWSHFLVDVGVVLESKIVAMEASGAVLSELNDWARLRMSPRASEEAKNQFLYLFSTLLEVPQAARVPFRLW